MKSPLVLLATALVTAAAVADADVANADVVSDEARIEQLIHHPPQAAATPERATAKARTSAKAPADPAVALIGRKVHVRTVDRGLYAGILQSLDASSVVLRIDLPKQALSYTLSRSGVAELQAAESAP